MKKHVGIVAIVCLLLTACAATPEEQMDGPTAIAMNVNEQLQTLPTDSIPKTQAEALAVIDALPNNLSGLYQLPPVIPVKGSVRMLTMKVKYAGPPGTMALTAAPLSVFAPAKTMREFFPNFAEKGPYTVMASRTGGSNVYYLTGVDPETYSFVAVWGAPAGSWVFIAEGSNREFLAAAVNALMPGAQFPPEIKMVPGPGWSIPLKPQKERA